MKVVSERAGYRIRACAKHAPDVRFGSKADIASRLPHVRFTPKSGHRVARLACPQVPNGDICTAEKNNPATDTDAAAFRRKAPT